MNRYRHDHKLPLETHSRMVWCNYSKDCNKGFPQGFSIHSFDRLYRSELENPLPPVCSAPHHQCKDHQLNDQKRSATDCAIRMPIFPSLLWDHYSRKKDWLME